MGTREMHGTGSAGRLACCDHRWDGLFGETLEYISLMIH
jgi:hypothetical protein